MMRDVDSAARAHAFRMASWALLAGMVGVLAATLIVGPSVRGTIAGFLIGVAAGGIVPELLGRGAARAAMAAFATRGIPGNPEFSLASSLEVRGDYTGAAAELQRQADIRPEDPEPCLLLARLHRDRLEDHLAAVAWFRLAINRSRDAGTALAALRELVELHTLRRGAPEGALVDLARFAARFPGSSEAEWARRELADVKSRVNFDS